MAKLQIDDLMVLNREDLDGTRKVYTFSGSDFNETVQQVIDDNELYELYVNRSGDDLFGPLFIDVNTDFVNPEDLLCLKLEGRAELKQLIIDPSDGGDAHMSMYFQGNREHLVYFNNHMNVIYREITEDNEIEDYVLVQLDRASVHVATDLTVGVSASFPNIRLQETGEATFQGRVLLADLDNLDYNHAIHKGYVDDLDEVLRAEVLTYVEVDDEYSYNYENSNFTGTVTKGQFVFLYETDKTGTPGSSGFQTVHSTEPVINPDTDEVEDVPMTNWDSIDQFILSDTTVNDLNPDEQSFPIGSVLRIDNVNDTSNDDNNYTVAFYEVTSFEKDEDGNVIIGVSFDRLDELLDDDDEPIEMPDPQYNERYKFTTSVQEDNETVLGGRFLWKLIPNAVDGNGDSIDDWRALDKIHLSQTTVVFDVGTLTPANFPAGSLLEIYTLEEEQEIRKVTVTIDSSELITVTSLDQGLFTLVDTEVIELDVSIDTMGENIELNPSDLHIFKVANKVPVIDYVQRENSLLDSKIQNNSDAIHTLDRELQALEGAKERGSYIYAAGNESPPFQYFSLTNATGDTITNLANPTISVVYINKIDKLGNSQTWDPGVTDFDLYPFNLNITPDTDGDPGYASLRATGFEDLGEYVAFSVAYNSGFNHSITSGQTYTIKVVSNSDSLTRTEAAELYAFKTGEPNLKGTHRYKNTFDNDAIIIDTENTEIVLGNQNGLADGVLTFKGDPGVIKYNTTNALTIGQTVTVHADMDFSSGGEDELSISGLRTPDPGEGSNAATVSYVNDKITNNQPTARADVAGGFKIDPRAGYTIEDGVLKLRYAQSYTGSPSVEQMGIAAYDDETMFVSQNEAKTYTGVKVRKDPSRTKYGIIKIDDETLQLNDDKQLYARYASTSESGVVQLSSATNSSSTTLAATASAVKAAKDAATSASTAAANAQTAADNAQSTANGRMTRSNLEGAKVVKSSSSGTYSGGFYTSNGNLYWRQ